MFCPLKFNSNTVNTAGVTQPGQCQCEETECAWWHEDYTKCAILAIASIPSRLLYLNESVREAHGLQG